MNRVEDRELRRNGEGYLDPTAYQAIMRADGEAEGEYDGQCYKGPYEKGRGMTLKQYKRWKLKVLRELCIEMTDEEKAYLESLTNEGDIDRYARKLIMRGED